MLSISVKITHTHTHTRTHTHTHTLRNGIKEGEERLSFIQSPIISCWPMCNMISRCGKCGYTYTHTKNVQTLHHFPTFVESHFTCICMLFENSVVCCLRGYSNLLTNVPVLAFYTGLPIRSYDEWNRWTSLGVQHHQNSDFVQSCALVKKSVCNSYMDSSMS